MRELPMIELPAYVQNLNQDDFYYELPEERIAKFPLKERDQSKLLFYKHGELAHHRFYNLPELLPQNSLLFFNNTRVIPARLFFKKPTGAYIEIFLLHPLSPSGILPLVMQTEGRCEWKCMIGNLKKWTESLPLVLELEVQQEPVTLTAELTDRENMHVRLSWNKSIRFIEVLKACGEIPLPPYINRKAEKEDAERYQTVYSHKEGAVAAPTAGLHFTEKVLDNLKKAGHCTDYLTLHVSAGTFQPIKSKKVIEHNMHSEQVVVSKENIENILKNINNIIAVGTTSLRTLESLYWFGVQIIKNNNKVFKVEKLIPYRFKDEDLPSLEEGLTAIIRLMSEQGLHELIGETEIFIVPGYKFKVCNGLVTNFHLPGSTLILLIAAFTGQAWKNIYKEALEHDYRFLSYGDSSLLLGSQ